MGDAIVIPQNKYREMKPKNENNKSYFIQNISQIIKKTFYACYVRKYSVSINQK